MATKKRYKTLSQMDSANSRGEPAKQPVQQDNKEGNSIGTFSKLGFSSVTFRPIPASKLIHSDELSDKAVRQLTAAYNNYCKLCGCKTETTLGGKVSSKMEHTRKMYRHLERLVESSHKNTYLNIDKTEEDNFHFTAYAHCDFDQEIFIFPLQFLDWLDNRNSLLFNPMIRLYGYLVHKIGFSTHLDSMWLQYNLEILCNEIDDGGLEEEEENKGLELIDVYKRKANPLLNWIDDNYEEVDKNYIFYVQSLQVSPKLKYLKQWLVDGFRLMLDPNCKSLHCFQYNHEDVNEDAVGIDRLFMIAYSENDTVSQMAIDNANIDSGEFGEYTPTQWLVINDKTKQTFTYSPWVDEFKKWMNRGLVAIGSYTKKSKYNN